MSSLTAVTYLFTQGTYTNVKNTVQTSIFTGKIAYMTIVSADRKNHDATPTAPHIPNLYALSSIMLQLVAKHKNYNMAAKHCPCNCSWQEAITIQSIIFINLKTPLYPLL